MGLVARQPRLVTRDNRSTRRAPRATHADNDRHPETPIPANGHTFRAIEANRNRPGKITCITVRVVRSRSDVDVRFRASCHDLLPDRHVVG